MTEPKWCVSVTGLEPRLRFFFVEINLKIFQGAQTPHQCKASFNSTHMQSVRPPPSPSPPENNDEKREHQMEMSFVIF